MTEFNNTKLRMLIQAGAVGICILLIGLLTFVFTKYDKLATTRSQEFTNVIQENIRVQSELITAVKELKSYIIYRQTAVK